MAAYDESREGEDILEQGAGPPGPGRLNFAAPRWLGFLGRGFGAGGGDNNPGWRPSRGAAVLAAVTLVAGLGAGYAAGRSTSGGARPAPRASNATTTLAPSTPAQVRPPASSLADVGPAVGQLIESCSTQTGTRLQLGIEVSNTSSAAVTLTGVTPVFPGGPGGLHETSWQWGSCGDITSGVRPSAVSLSPGETTWLSVILKVLVRCPAAYPVQFDVKYVTHGGVHVTASLPGFPDLGQVQYSGCPSSSGSSGSSTFSAVFLGPVGNPVTVHTLKRR